MKKIVIFLTFAILMVCVSVTPSFASLKDPQRKEAESILQQGLTRDGQDEPFLDWQPGTVTNPIGTEIGTLLDFVLDLKTGRIAYAIGTFEQIPQFRNKLFVIPWGVIKLDPEMTTFMLIGDKAALASAPNFSQETTWSDLPLSRWTAIVDAHWRDQGERGYAVSHDSGPLLYKASDLLGLAIKNREKKSMGKIEQLLMEPETGEIAYVILSTTKSAKSNETLVFSLPWSSVQVKLNERIHQVSEE